MKNLYPKIIELINSLNIKMTDLMWFVLFPILNTNYILAANIAGTGKNIETKLDRIIPFKPIFIIPYIYWYIFVAIGLIYILHKSRTRYIRAFIAITIGMCCCYLFYYIFPTQISRPSIENTNLITKLVNYIYLKDKPFNCFPSIHVLNTYIIMRYTKKTYNKKVFYYTQVSGILIIFSTVFIKQHFVLDILGSIILCEAVIVISKKIKSANINKVLNLPMNIYSLFNKNDEISL